MLFTSTNPATGEILHTFPFWNSSQVESALAKTPDARTHWSAKDLHERAALISACAAVLRQGKEQFARLISLEMGKLKTEARHEIDKCAWVLEYFASHADEFLADEVVATEATHSVVVYQPLGTILAIMPWNFPFWQVFRATAPMLLAGNAVLLKHAPTVSGCALAIEQAFCDAGFPEGVFQTLLVGVDAVEGLLADSRVHGMTFTGSVRAGREVAQIAGFNLKKTVLELGGSDAFIVLEDADLEWTVAHAIASRFVNAGQSCIAAKRFIVIDSIADEFVERFRCRAQALQAGDPLDDSTSLAPLARSDLRVALHRQVSASLAAGASPVCGCEAMEGPGYFYLPSVLDRVQPGMAAFDEEVFGPVAAIIRVRDEKEAVQLANHSRYGLGGSVWTGDIERGERIIRQLQCGMGFVNAVVQSDPRLPCGGVKESGFGRELSVHGLREFVNLKSVWIK